MINKTKKIAVFASGNGSNAEQIFKHFQDDVEIEVSLLLSNKKDAFVIERAKNYNIPVKTVSREVFYNSFEVVSLLQELEIDLVALAGFLWLLPENLIQAFANRIVNIHPALLPKYGGKGMYGMYVHEAVLKAGEKESGITIHYINDKYDEGEIIFQKECKINEGDKPEDVAVKIQRLEHQYYPKVIGDILRK